MAVLPVRRNSDGTPISWRPAMPLWPWLSKVRLLDAIRGYERVEQQWLKATYPNTQLWCIGWFIMINFIKCPIVLCFTVLMLLFQWQTKCFHVSSPKPQWRVMSNAWVAKASPMSVVGPTFHGGSCLPAPCLVGLLFGMLCTMMPAFRPRSRSRGGRPPPHREEEEEDCGMEEGQEGGEEEAQEVDLPIIEPDEVSEAEGPFDLDMVFKAVHVDDLPEGDWNCECQRGAPCSICPERRELILLALKPFHIFCEKGAGFASLYLTKIAC